MNRGESLDNDVKLGEMLAEIRHKIDRLESEVADNDRKWQMLIDKVAAMRNAANQESDSELVKALATIEGYIAMININTAGKEG